MKKFVVENQFKNDNDEWDWVDSYGDYTEAEDAIEAIELYKQWLIDNLDHEFVIENYEGGVEEFLEEVESDGYRAQEIIIDEDGFEGRGPWIYENCSGR